MSLLRTNGIGKVKVGMTVKQARRAAGVYMVKSRVGDWVDLTTPDREAALRFSGVLPAQLAHPLEAGPARADRLAVRARDPQCGTFCPIRGATA